MIDLANLPAEASAYFQAAEGQVPWEQVFTPDASVRDVDREIRGLDSIAQWARSEVDGGTYQILSYQPEDGGVWLLVEFHPRDWHAFLAEYRFSFRGGRLHRAVLQYSPEVAVLLRPIPLPVRHDFESGQALPGTLTRVTPRVGGLRLEFAASNRQGIVWDYWIEGQRWGRRP